MTDAPRYFTAWGPDGRSVVRCEFPLNPNAIQHWAEDDSRDAEIVSLRMRGKTWREVADLTSKPISTCQFRHKRFIERQAAE